MKRTPYQPASIRKRCKCCGYPIRKPAESVNPYDASEPRVTCKCKKL